MSEQSLLPNGSRILLNEAFGDEVQVVDLSNDFPAIAEVTNHPFVTNDYVLLRSSWSRADGRIARVGQVTPTTVELIGIDTSNKSLFNVGGGSGTLVSIGQLYELPHIINFTTSGGEQQFATWQELADQNERRIPTVRSAQGATFGITVESDGSKGLEIALNASLATEKRAVIIRRPNGSESCFYSYVSVNEIPSQDVNNVQNYSSTLSFDSRPTLIKSGV